MEETMLNLSGFSHKHHPSGVKMLAKYIKRGISVIWCFTKPWIENSSSFLVRRITKKNDCEDI